MLTITSIKTSLKQTSGKQLCSCSVYALTATRPGCWFDARQPVTPIARFYAILEIASTYWLSFCLLSLKIYYFLPSNWEHFVWKLHVMFWVVCSKAHLHIFVENTLVVTPDLAVVSAGFLACFLLLSLPYLLEKMTERGLWHLHNHHSDIYQSVNLRTFSWESG